MKTFIEWCEHYGYEPASPEAKADYDRYSEQLALFQALPDEPCFMGGDEPLDPPPLINRGKALAELHTPPHPSGRGKGR